MADRAAPLPTPTTPEALTALAADFDAQRIPQRAWTHEAHVLVALWHVLHRPDPLSHLRTGIQRLNRAHGVPNTLERGYHETLTRFYVRVLERLVAARRSQRGEDPPLPELAAAALAHATRDLPLAYYSRERLFSAEARLGWCEPDLRPLDD